MARRLVAEFLGTFWLVLCGCGAAVFSATAGGVGILGVAVAFGLTVVTMAYALGPISGAHFNPAVTIGLAAARKFERTSVIPYVIAQTVAGIAAALVLYLIASASPAYDPAVGLAANGYGVHSPGRYSWGAGLSAELILTGGFVFIIAALSSQRSLRLFAPLVIGLALLLANLVAIPITNASINPARSTGPALVAAGWALSQLWLFWVAPVLGGVIGGAIARAILPEEQLPGETAHGELGEPGDLGERPREKKVANF